MNPDVPHDYVDNGSGVCSLCGVSESKHAEAMQRMMETQPNGASLTWDISSSLSLPFINKVLEVARKFSAGERKKAADAGAAMPDGSFPIKNAQDLKNAIQAIGRAKDPAAAKAHIKRRAAALGLTNLLPNDWK